MNYRINLNNQPGIRKGRLIWTEEGKMESLDLGKGPFLLRIVGEELILQPQSEADYKLRDLGIKLYSFLWDEQLYGLDEGQTQMWFGWHTLPDPGQKVLGLHAIGTSDISDIFPNKTEIARQISINLDYDSEVFQASIGLSQDAPNCIFFQQSSELFHGTRRINKPIPGLYQPGVK